MNGQKDNERRQPTEDRKKVIGMLLQHIRDLCGKGENDFYGFFLDCLAFKIKFPQRKKNHCICALCHEDMKYIHLGNVLNKWGGRGWAL